MKITHVIVSLDVGGAERVVLNLVEQGRRQGHSVNVLCVERTGALAARAELLGANVYCVGKPPGLKFQTTRDIEKFLVEDPPDVVHTHQIGALFYAGPAARRVGIPVVVHTEHGIHFENGRRARWLGRWAARSARRFFCVSHDIANSVIANKVAPRRKVFVVENGIDTHSISAPVDRAAIRASLGIPASAPVIGMVGRLAAVKSLDVLLRAFADLSAVGEPPHLLIVGDGPMKNDLLGLAAELKIEERTHFVGYQSRPEQFLHVMDVFGLTSSSEGMPMCILEAWAVGIPVVASRVGGLPDLIADGRTGFLFPAGDHAKLARILENLMADPAMRRAAATAGGEQVRSRFDASVMAANYERHYAELLEESSGFRRGSEKSPLTLAR
jgi:glycosyltransferase involved in cell wall biosynthesis